MVVDKTTTTRQNLAEIDKFHTNQRKQMLNLNKIKKTKAQADPG